MTQPPHSPLRATAVIRKPEVDSAKIIDWVVLDHADRHRRRIALTGVEGTAFLLDLERPAGLEHGDGLALEDGRVIGVRAAAQRLYEVRCDDHHALPRVAWHIGNRHTPAEFTHHAVYIEEDHVLAEMLKGLGCRVESVIRPFHPERGAYDGASRGHGHSHDHDHSDSHGDHHHHHDH